MSGAATCRLDVEWFVVVGRVGVGLAAGCALVEDILSGRPELPHNAGLFVMILRLTVVVTRPWVHTAVTTLAFELAAAFDEVGGLT